MSDVDHRRQTWFWLAVAVLLSAVVYLLRGTLTPFIAAAILAYALAPAVARLERWKLPRSIAAALVMVAAVSVIVAVILILIPVLQSEYRMIRTQLPGLAATLSARLVPWLEHTLGITVALDAASIREWISAQLAGSSQDLLASLMQYARSGWTAAVEVIGLVVLVPVVLFYLLADWPVLVARLHELIPRRWVGTANDALGETDDLLGHYLRGQLLVMLSLAVWYSAALAVAGVTHWLSLGVLTGLLAFVPYLGFGIGLAVSLISAMLQLGIAQGAIAIAVVFGIGQLLESYWLTPRLVGERIGLHPVAVLFALLAFGALFGFAGLLLALPLSAVVLVVLRRLRRGWLASNFYQRP
jgi:predicted PurR-regulated permease PerM